MKKVLLLFLVPFALMAGTISAPLIAVNENEAIVEMPLTHTGISGFIVHHFDATHRTIVANAVVSGYDKEKQQATLTLSPYTGLRQNALPYGTWSPQVGDEAILGFAYSRGLLIAPTDRIYHQIVKRVPSLQWANPDGYAAFLTYRGHPSPDEKDFSDFCTLYNTGLLYIYVQQSLYTMDCQTMTLLQITPASFDQTEETKVPFYFRFETIPSSWWDWSAQAQPIKDYNTYYHNMISRNNQNSELLQTHMRKHGMPIPQEESGWFDGWDLGEWQIKLGQDEPTEQKGE